MANKKISLYEQVQLRRKADAMMKQLQVSSLDSCINELLPNYRPLPQQLDFHLATQREKIFIGGYGTGKSRTLSAEGIKLARINMPVMTMMLGESLEALIDSIEEPMEELTRENNIPYEYIQSKHEMLFVFDYKSKKEKRARIKLFGADAKLPGKNVASVLVDEIFSMKRKVMRILRGRVRNVKAVRPCIGGAGTPEADKMQHGFEYFEKKLPYADDKLFITKMRTKENIYLDPAFIDDLTANYSAKEIEAYMEAELVNLAGENCYHSFDRKNNVLPHLEIMKRMPAYGNKVVIISYDFNVNPMTASETWIDAKSGTRYMIQEYLLTSSNTRELSESIIVSLKRRYNLEQLSVTITGDTSGRRKQSSSDGRSDYEIIKECFDRSGIKYSIYLPQNINPEQRDRVNYMNNEFEKRTFFISDACKTAIRDFELVIWKAGTDKFFIDKSKSDLSHMSDNIGYGAYNTAGYVNQLRSGSSMIMIKRRDRRR